MKKLFVLLLSSLLLVYGSISASAYGSDNVNNKDNSKTDSNGNGSSSNTSSTSPKTGATSTYAILMAGAALAFGGVAAGAKKKLGE